MLMPSILAGCKRRRAMNRAAVLDCRDPQCDTIMQRSGSPCDHARDQYGRSPEPAHRKSESPGFQDILHLMGKKGKTSYNRSSSSRKDRNSPGPGRQRQKPRNWAGQYRRLPQPRRLRSPRVIARSTHQVGTAVTKPTRQSHERHSKHGRQLRNNKGDNMSSMISNLGSSMGNNLGPPDIGEHSGMGEPEEYRPE